MDVFTKSKYKRGINNILITFFDGLFLYLAILSAIVWFSNPSQNIKFHIRLICWKIGLFELELCIFIFCRLLLLWRGGRTWPLKAKWLNWFYGLDLLTMI